MYQLNRQLDLIESINWRVVRAKGETKDKIMLLARICREHLKHADVFIDPNLTARAFVDFSSLVELIVEVGELPFQQNKWLLKVGIKLLYWFGPEEEIKARQVALP